MAREHQCSRLTGSGRWLHCVSAPNHAHQWKTIAFGKGNAYVLLSSFLQVTFALEQLFCKCGAWRGGNALIWPLIAMKMNNVTGKTEATNYFYGRGELHERPIRETMWQWNIFRNFETDSLEGLVLVTKPNDLLTTALSEFISAFCRTQSSGLQDIYKRRTRNIFWGQNILLEFWLTGYIGS